MTVEEVLFGNRAIETEQVELKGWQLTNPKSPNPDC
jgi:hypothetical protein